ncbi:helix-turn-helix transcriptional regulator [Pelagibacterium nitratireducens]|uniref:Helix-turn-helix transcriptional regulator n=1 Tax=Pelagibacterium nitratireducens TaxID=1046114 RepID=A0ABZ2I421_9HYPH
MKPPNDSIHTIDITAEQVRAARALVGWSQDELANRAGVTRRTIAAFESGEKVPHRSTMCRILSVFEDSRVSFINSGEVIGVVRKAQA